MLQRALGKSIARKFRCFSSIAPSTTEVKSRVTLAPFGSGGTITGFVAPGWEGMRAGFEDNFAMNLERGAQLCIYHGDEVVVDLTGFSSKQPGYCAETLQCVFSSGKNMEAICLAMLVDRGLVKYDDLVTKHWPEFGQHGKDAITVADVMRHEGRMNYLSDPGDPGKCVTVPMSALEDADVLEKLIEDAGTSSEAGSRVYHAITRGWIVSGIVRRVDPKQRTLGEFMRQEVTEPLGITYFCGIPETEQPNYKYADMTQLPKLHNFVFNVFPALVGMGCPVLGACINLFKDKNNPILKPVVEWMAKDPSPAFNNTVKGRKAEIPSAGMYTNARSMAKVNACMANGGKVGSFRLMSDKACADSVAGMVPKVDASLKWNIPFSQGGFGDFGEARGGMVDPAFTEFGQGLIGWGGWGGSLSVFSPSKRIGLSYTMNGMSNYLLGGPRSLNIFRPLHAITSKL